MFEYPQCWSLPLDGAIKSRSQLMRELSGEARISWPLWSRASDSVGSSKLSATVAEKSGSRLGIRSQSPALRFSIPFLPGFLECAPTIWIKNDSCPPIAVIKLAEGIFLGPGKVTINAIRRQNVTRKAVIPTVNQVKGIVRNVTKIIDNKRSRSIRYRWVRSKSSIVAVSVMRSKFWF